MRERPSDPDPSPVLDVTGRKAWAATTVFVCGSCDGDGRRLAKVLRREGRQRLGRRSVRVVRCSCLSLCPKRGVSVVVVRPGGSQAIVTRAGASHDEVADALFPPG